MSPNLAGLPQRYLRTPEAARFVGLSIRTLEKHRIYGTGPRYSKLGGRVVYPPCLDAMLPPSQDTPGILMLSTPGEHAARPPPGLDTALDVSGCAKPDVLRCPHGHGGAFTKGAVE
jgi:hypothetical protein